MSDLVIAFLCGCIAGMVAFLVMWSFAAGVWRKQP